MKYDAPRMTEVGSVRDLTLGKLASGPKKDNNIWWDIWGDPADPNPPVGSR